MHFNAYGGNAALLSAAVANLDFTAGTSSVEELLTDHRVDRATLTADQLAQLMTWRVRLREVFAAATTPEKVALVNELLAEATARPYVSTHGGRAPHLHYADEDDDVLTRVRATTAAGLALVIAESDPHRLGRCAAPGCQTVFVDVSRNARRTYCSRLCATRVHVSAHRCRAQDASRSEGP